MDNVTARQFWEKLLDALREEAPSGYGAQWTAGMYAALHGVQAHFGLWCQCNAHCGRPHGSDGERLGIDLTWFREHPALSGDEQEWVPPVVAIEHENLYGPRERSVDHWKVSQIATPLRVFIGYVSKPTDVDGAGRTLKDRESRWHTVANGEALVVLGHKKMCCGCFRAWCTPQGTMNWTELSNELESCSHCET